MPRKRVKRVMSAAMEGASLRAKKAEGKDARDRPTQVNG